MNVNEDKKIPEDGIEVLEKLCPCGGHLRLHTYTFNRNKPTQTTKLYIDCENYCGKVSEWRNSLEEAMSEFEESK